MSKRKLPISVGMALEGTITGAIHRSRFATKICKLSEYTKLLDYLEHGNSCPSRPDYWPHGDCTCGLYEFLREGPEE